jgi:hypothetical protein
MLRVALGALFAVVLTLPFGYPEFLAFCDGIRFPHLPTNPDKPPATGSVLTTQAVFLLLPFVLGFSTSLVILILNQFVEAVQAFFGRKPSTLTAPPLPPRVTTAGDAGHASPPASAAVTSPASPAATTVGVPAPKPALSGGG